MGDDKNLADFGATFSTFMKRMNAQAPEEETPFARRLRALFGADPKALPVVAEKFPSSDHANVDLAVEAFLGGSESHEVVGVAGVHDMFGASLSGLVTGASKRMGAGADEGPVEYKNLEVAPDKVRSCIGTAVLLVRTQDGPIALLIQGPGERFSRSGVRVEVMATEKARGERCLAFLRETMRKRNIYRGQVVSLEVEQQELKVGFHELPTIARSKIILPVGVLDRIERQAVAFSTHREKLRKVNRHLKRGLLLHGPPGTGKTLSAMYLAGLMPDRTVLLLTGRGVGLIEHSCRLARRLEPATLIVEDVDLIATLREEQSTNANAVLFELLNQMDGLSDDADLLFVLTTNRPDILEPALAARPGRVDMAIEVPLPDNDCRRRLIELYGADLDLRLQELDRFVERTDGVSASFIRELLRRAALVAADEGQEIAVRDHHLDAALKELLLDSDALTKTLLGASESKATSRRPTC
jgi:hypothetical protein